LPAKIAKQSKNILNALRVAGARSRKAMEKETEKKDIEIVEGELLEVSTGE
jgi:hypothetical protein